MPIEHASRRDEKPSPFREKQYLAMGKFEPLEREVQQHMYCVVPHDFEGTALEYLHLPDKMWKGGIRCARLWVDPHRCYKEGAYYHVNFSIPDDAVIHVNPFGYRILDNTGALIVGRDGDNYYAGRGLQPELLYLNKVYKY